MNCEQWFDALCVHVLPSAITCFVARCILYRRRKLLSDMMLHCSDELNTSFNWLATHHFIRRSRKCYEHCTACDDSLNIDTAVIWPAGAIQCVMKMQQLISAKSQSTLDPNWTHGLADLWWCYWASKYEDPSWDYVAPVAFGHRRIRILYADY